jgi:hypothetical protein
MDDPRQWVWTPSLEAGQVCLAALVLAGLTGAAVAALWAVRVPGEVGSVERRRRWAGARLAARLAAAAVWLAPAALFAGAAYLFFPVSPPQTVLLASRSRLADRTDEEWAAEWAGLLREKHAGPGGRCVDVGPVVDAVCRRLGEGAGGWRKDDPQARRLAAALLDELQEGGGRRRSPTRAPQTSAGRRRCPAGSSSRWS